MKRSMKKIRKKLAIGIGLILLLVVAALVAVQLFFGRIASFTVENTVPKLTGAPASLGDARFNILSGELHISDLVLWNPEGYSGSSAFELASMRINIAMGSLASDTVRIESIVVDGMQVTYEAGLPSNIGRIKENLNNASKKEKSSGEAPGDMPQKKQRKIQIGEIKVINSQVRASVKGLGGAAVPVPLPSIVIKDIGGKNEGVTFSESLDIFVTELLSSVQSSVSGTGQILKDGAEGAAKGAKKAMDKIGGIFE
jgi:uncharacterized protein involved in outer membrane biogenesis